MINTIQNQPKQPYICASWQGLAYQIRDLVGRGYRFYHVTYLPDKKKSKWPQIDGKLIKRYQTDKSKFQRAYNKRKGFANFFYLRWESIAVILHTEGQIPDDISIEDQFFDVEERPMTLKISDKVELEILKIKLNDKPRATVRLGHKTISYLQRELSRAVRSGSLWKVHAAFDRLNGFPTWGGVLRQKDQLRKHLIHEARRHGLKIGYKDLRFTTHSPRPKIWAETQPPGTESTKPGKGRQKRRS